MLNNDLEFTIENHTLGKKKKIFKININSVKKETMF
jgi:hypothetical protein